ncbi:hypothetical protein CDD83_3911 [Cordyceps sp. RAO-2017]|nr:hypothetical protein CDD83_3911 [Cordyceps sp. RAO-2017]
MGKNYSDFADESVKGHWIAQGIWRDEWNPTQPGRLGRPGARWKHENPYEPESETEDDTEDDTEPEPLGLFGRKPKPPRRRLKSKEERQRIEERRPAREQARQASRPFAQFVYQLSLERERMLDGEARARGLRPNGTANDNEGSYADAEADMLSLPDLNSRAYGLVKDR